ncbi:hypothetical protein MHB85_20205 [Paenibacillus sp. FSL K6-4396]|uniref:hypothetical protein n=1 Tax=Paenibacillus sp. FSL K6-4396 TaxID=2921506 RepID=UPI0030F7B666
MKITKPSLEERLLQANREVQEIKDNKNREEEKLEELKQEVNTHFESILKSFHSKMIVKEGYSIKNGVVSATFYETPITIELKDIHAYLNENQTDILPYLLDVIVATYRSANNLEPEVI